MFSQQAILHRNRQKGTLVFMEKQTLTSHELKKQNRSKVYQYIYHTRGASRPELAAALQMSLPTLSQNLLELEQKQLITKSGFKASTGGRKAQILACNATARIAIGAEILKEFVQVCAIDLYGSVIGQTQVELPFSNEPAYFQLLGSAFHGFIASLPWDKSQILGVGIAIQGLVSADSQQVTYGKILNCSGLTLSQFQQYLDFPCLLIHDSEAAACAELVHLKNISHAVYLSLNRNLGGAIILNGSVYRGNSLLSGTLEHICMIPGGRPCYCGKNGCLETYCSADSLKQSSGLSLDVFFQRLRSHEKRESEIWHTYLEHLAMAISNIRHVIDCDVIIGGLLNTYLTEEDFLLLTELTQHFCTLSDKKIHLISGRHDLNLASVGAGLCYITEFLNQI